MATSCRAYDNGVHSEALRLATTVSIIVHDGGQNRSILGQLGIKEQIEWCASNTDVKNMSAVIQRATPLVELDTTPNGPDFVPLCTYVKNHNALIAPRSLSLKDWRMNDLIFVDNGKTLTRQNLVLTIRNQDGGSHFDKEVRNTHYIALKEDVLMFFPGTPLSNFPGAGLRSMRQIAEEVRPSLGQFDAEREGPQSDGTFKVVI